MSEAFPDWQPQSDILIMDLGAETIKCFNDCEVLWDELESVAQDYPEYKIIIFKLNGTA